MPSNMLMGAGPAAQGGGGNADGPPTNLQGTLGATPQAAPTMGANMLAGGAPGAPQGAGGPQQQIVPPSIEKLHEVYHKQAYTVHALKGLLGKPDLSTKDILSEVGDAVADGILGPFDAARELETIPPGGDSLQLRQWIGQHYANASQALQTVSEMIAAHGQMTRRQGIVPPPSSAPQSMPQQNAMATPMSPMMH